MKVGIIFEFEAVDVDSIQLHEKGADLFGITLTKPLGKMPIGQRISAFQVSWETTLSARLKLREDTEWSSWFPCDGALFKALQFISALPSAKPTPGALNLGPVKFQVGQVKEPE